MQFLHHMFNMSALDDALKPGDATDQWRGQ